MTRNAQTYHQRRFESAACRAGGVCALYPSTTYLPSSLPLPITRQKQHEMAGERYNNDKAYINRRPPNRRNPGGVA